GRGGGVAYSAAVLRAVVGATMGVAATVAAMAAATVAAEPGPPRGLSTLALRDTLSGARSSPGRDHSSGRTWHG
ncbi:MAG TPA: hypothetical protein VFD74_04305, partial [Thermoleophilia bacterium]|nr:hypothetical protein [Thermoleophilia bacterium]